MAAALQALLPEGLPARLETVTANRCLLDLRGVIARSSDPDDDASRLTALNQVLVQQIRKVPDSRQRDLAAAAVVLFGLNKASRRLDLTRRYNEAAEVVRYDRDHFRKKIVPKILKQLAVQLHQDSANYSGRASVAVEISGDSPSVEMKHISSREVALHEEQKSRIWEYVYGLRAEILAVHRLKEWPEAEHGFLKLEEARQSMLWYIARLMASIHSFVNMYGTEVTKGHALYNADSLIRLAGWTGELPPELAYKARLLAMQEPTREGFLRAAKEAGLTIVGVGD